MKITFKHYMKTLHHKKNEKQEVEFFQDKECTIPFDFTNAEDLYIDGLNGDITPLIAMEDKIRCTATVYTPYIPQNQKPPYYVKTLNDITPNLSKYIPEDNAVLFLSRKDKKAYVQFFINHNNLLEDIETYKIALQIHNIDTPKSITIFLPHGTQSELQKANKVEKELMEKYGIEEVNLFALHWFGSEYQENDFEIEYLCKDFGVLSNFNKVITTNSTGILPVQDNERLQVIDCKEMFEDFLNGNN